MTLSMTYALYVYLLLVHSRSIYFANSLQTVVFEPLYCELT
jgi:hypothetical protein